MKSFPDGFNALVIGSSGGIGSQLASELGSAANHGNIVRLSRSNTEDFDLTDENSISAAAARLRQNHGSFQIIFCATGVLDIGGVGPEKALSDLDPLTMASAFAVNTIGPALLFKHFVPLLPASGKCVFAVLSARVGSIGDNRLGGWYSYRSSKAALNQLVKSASIEIARNRPDAICLALHPGTIETGLSRPHARGRFTHAPDQAAKNLLKVIDGVTPESTGGFMAYDGSVIPW